MGWREGNGVGIGKNGSGERGWGSTESGKDRWCKGK